MAFETINLGTQPTGTGGDTARSAFEKVNKNFITAEVLASSMSQAQFEAIRAQNNEEYAASGFVHFGKHINIANVYTPIKTGLYAVLSGSLPNKLLMGTNYSINEGNSKTEYAVINIAGVTYNANLENNVDEYTKTTIKFPQAPDGKTTYNKSTGANIVHSTTTAAFNAAGADPTNVEVVTDRVDMWGFESFLEEVSATNPYVYPSGLIQSLATTMDGIATSASNRPDTYYAWFNGDTSSKGKGVNYFTLTDAQKRKVLANYKNKLYFLDDGRLVQWRLRGRSFAGAGNGDWDQVDSTIKNVLRFDSNNLIKSQGTLNASLPANPSWSTNTLFGTSTADFGSSEAGVFASKYGDTSSSANGECYFLLCGTANRLNQGAYHPSFNPSGSQGWNKSDGWADKWHNGGVTTPIDKASAFKKATTINGVGTCFNTNTGGSLGSITSNGRPDERVYDAIYASGQGGVCRDMRYSANHTTLEKFAEADLNVKNGTYRGFEKLVSTVMFQFTLKNSDPYAGGYYYNFNENTNPANYAKKGTAVYFSRTQKLGFVCVSESYDGGSIYLCNNKKDSLLGISTLNPLDNSGLVPGDVAIVLHEEQLSSVGGSFLQTDVIGNPANILLTDALKNGWKGSWLGTGAGSGPLDMSLSRKAISTQVATVYSLNNGSSWSTTSSAFDPIANKVTVGLNNSLLSVNQYQAFAKQTEPTINTKIYGGARGLGDVYSNARYATSKGALLGESLIDKICISGNQSSIQSRSLALSSFSIWENGLLSQDNFENAEHSVLDMGSPTNNSPAFKALNYSTETNLQAGMIYAATELKWDGTDWGDDSRIHIVNNANTLIDLNGNAVKVVTHKLKEPIGWIKNTI